MPRRSAALSHDRGATAAPQGQGLTRAVGVSLLFLALLLPSLDACALTDNELLQQLVNVQVLMITAFTEVAAYVYLIPYIAFALLFAIGFRQGMVR